MNSMGTQEMNRIMIDHHGSVEGDVGAKPSDDTTTTTTSNGDSRNADAVAVTVAVEPSCPDRHPADANGTIAATTPPSAACHPPASVPSSRRPVERPSISGDGDDSDSDGDGEMDDDVIRQRMAALREKRRWRRLSSGGRRGKEAVVAGGDGDGGDGGDGGGGRGGVPSQRPPSQSGDDRQLFEGDRRDIDDNRNNSSKNDNGDDGSSFDNRKSSSTAAAAGLDAPPSPSARRVSRISGTNQRRRRRLTRLTKSASSPSIVSLVTGDSGHGLDRDGHSSHGSLADDRPSDDRDRDRYHVGDGSFREEDFGRPLLAQRRSLSPDITSRPSAARRYYETRYLPARLDDDLRRSRRDLSFHSSAFDLHSHSIASFGHGANANVNNHNHNNHNSNGPNNNLLIGEHHHPRHRYPRRLSLPAIGILPVLTSSETSHTEYMDPNAMRYLPKILRDTYAQRSRRRRPSSAAANMGEATLADFDLKLRLQRPERLPHYQDIRGSILILDLSGFTALGERLRMELGSRDGAAEFAIRVNDTLSMMVKQVYKYWGDVLMFAGDALICLFEERDYDEREKVFQSKLRRKSSVSMGSMVDPFGDGMSQQQHYGHRPHSRRGSVVGEGGGSGSVANQSHVSFGGSRRGSAMSGSYQGDRRSSISSLDAITSALLGDDYIPPSRTQQRKQQPQPPPPPPPQSQSQHHSQSQSQSRDSRDPHNDLTVEQKTKQRVRNCCLSVLGKIATEKDFTIHGGAAHGMIRCFFLGTPSKNPGSCAFVVSGHPLKQTGVLLNKAGRGEVYFDGEEKPITEVEGVKFVKELQKKNLMVSVADGLTHGFEELSLFGEESSASASDDDDDDDDDDSSDMDDMRSSRRSLVSIYNSDEEDTRNNVMPRDTTLFTDQHISADMLGGFEVHPYARAYLGTLAARRCDQDSQNAMSILLNELRPVAIVFVGLHDLDDIDPRDSTLLQLMNDAFKILSRITHACNGAVRDMLFDDKGCVFISVFGAHSHEVNPCFDATVSAMRMESALKDLKLKRFSLGVSFGECFCGEVGPPIRSDYVVMGPEVNLAARLMGKAPNRGTLVSKRIYSHSKKFIHFIKSQEIQVKGKDGFFHAYIPQTRIERQNLEIAEPQQPFVIMPSRQSAMDSLMQVKERAAEGKPTICFVSGGPFLGKSRLIDEVAGKAANDGFTILKSFRTSLDSFTSFFPLRQIVSAAMIKCAMLTAGNGREIDNEVSAANYLVDENIFKKTDRVNIGSIVPTVADAQLLSLLSGLNPKARTRTIVDSLMKILKLLQPFMIILEGDGDIDPSSWSLLAELMQRAGAECPQIMLIVSSRDSPTITSAASNLRRNAVQVKLTPFEKYETELFLRVMLGVRNREIAVDQKLLDVVHDRANGCPLFIECVVRWALEKNMIEYVEGSKKMSLKMLDERSDDVTAAIPRELSNILLAPFNNLPPPLWDALKIASCIGYSFDADLYSTLNQVLDFMPKIRELAAKHECFEQTGSHFRWKQQAVYEAVKSLLMVNQRQNIHRMIVRAFKQHKISNDDIDVKGGDVHRLLGRHCALAQDWAGAFEQYMKAGDRAKATFNFNEASKMYEEAIDFQAKMSEQPPLRSRMIPTINLGTCLRELARYKEAEAVLTRCLNEAQSEFSDITLDEHLYVRALTALAALYQAQSKYEAARKLYEKAVPIARNIQESKSSLWLAGNIAGYAETLRKSGDLPQAESHHREALEIRTRAVQEKSCTELELAVSYTQLGCTLAGMRQYEDAYEQHHRALALRYRYLDFSHGLVSESLNYCAESLCALGRGGEGIPLALHAVEIRKLIFGTSHPAYAHALSVLASCYHAVGRSFDARDCLEKCLEICEVAFQKNHANIIPNLMNYGNVLRSTGDLVKARIVYQRAITIHQLNFKRGQQASQLEKCKTELEDLSRKIELLESSASSATNNLSLAPSKVVFAPPDIEDKGTPVIVFTDIGRDVDDELALVVMASLRRMHLLNPIAVITTLCPEESRAHLARGTLDAIGMADVPVGVGSSGGVDSDVELEVYGADYSRPSPCIHENGMELVYRALESVPPKSAQILCISSLTDVASLIREREELFTLKVKEVVLMGGVVSLEAGDALIPDSAYNNNCDVSAARFVYKKCQELGVPTATLSRWAAYGCPIPPQLLDEIAKTEHMVATNVRGVSKLSIDQLWNKVILHPADPRREKLPSRCDINWFCRTFMGTTEVSKDWSSSIWSHVKKLNMYDPLAVLLCVPAYRSTHFKWKTKIVNGVQHIVVGTSELDTGISNRISLYHEYATLFLTAFTESLHKEKSSFL
ncbi:hypothetical protein ACHAXS_009513 [Conticribra weissflogii]